jgi:hypothetical protein
VNKENQDSRDELRGIIDKNRDVESYHRSSKRVLYVVAFIVVASASMFIHFTFPQKDKEVLIYEISFPHPEYAEDAEDAAPELIGGPN